LAPSVRPASIAYSEILQGELRLVMGNCGTRIVADITRAYVATPDWRL
jgi:hypothetical protein